MVLLVILAQSSNPNLAPTLPTASITTNNYYAMATLPTVYAYFAASKKNC
ncbi:hypothetical protein CONPUDRAFT_154847 [Coniophora puteana RWD-64-598 SS2]|uniref:Uncharacterized protein n=1 Tax=Coniophora puteana (strain RWD-64-598) TaxID=741705 RepID=A0A5M3MNW2_CONPW|nr:uncharacterized protein CONPUDRAFT_154847 [Coniophora puteana RWD-64-598 SS2]EIW80858.1 hypothetical protein CONPUDRAFT_154847 [Coniophora puteana RWD-64-598 SS2]